MKNTEVKQFLIAGTHVNIYLPSKEERQKSPEVIANVTNKLSHYKKEYSIENNTNLICSTLYYVMSEYLELINENNKLLNTLEALENKLNIILNNNK